MNDFVESRLAYIGGHCRLLQTVFEMIQMAQRSIVLQMYLFVANGHTTLVRPIADAFPEAGMIAGWLVEKKKKQPGVRIVVILDTQTPDDQQLKNFSGITIRQTLINAGITVLNANLFETKFSIEKKRPRAMRFHENWQNDPNPQTWVARQNHWQTLHNVEDHRKNLIIDAGAWALVTSHNFMDISCSWHENAFVFDGAGASQIWLLARQALTAALQIPQNINVAQKNDLIQFLNECGTAQKFDYQDFPLAPELHQYPADNTDKNASLHFETAALRVLDTHEIHSALLGRVNQSGEGDAILAASPYFSDPVLWQALCRAQKRGVDVKILSDNMRGLPLSAFLKLLIQCFVNRSFYEWSRDHPYMSVRVHDSSDFRMMHLKTIAFMGAKPTLIGGQANYTPRSFSGAWLESDVEIANAKVVEDFAVHFDELWNSAQSRPLARRHFGNLVFGKFCLGILKILSWIGLEL